MLNSICSIYVDLKLSLSIHVPLGTRSIYLAISVTTEWPTLLFRFFDKCVIGLVLSTSLQTALLFHSYLGLA